MSDTVENVILIVVDALRTDRVGIQGGGDLTPNIDEIGEDGEIFEQCYSCTNVTDSSMSTILTGLYPTRHGVLSHGNDVTEEEQRCVAGTTPLPELLDNTHYTVGIDTIERWHKRGFDTYVNPHNNRNQVTENLAKLKRHVPERVGSRAKQIYQYLIGSDIRHTSSDFITDRSIREIEFSEEPLFLLAHYWDCHLPYPLSETHPEEVLDREYDNEDIPLEELFESIKGSHWEEQLRRLSDGANTVGEMKRKYDAGVMLADQAIGKLVDALKSNEIYEETAIVITADHGESLTEHEIYFDHHGLYEPSIHVPLIIKAPGFEGREKQFVQHFDIVPTILELVGESYEPGQFDGVSLVNEDGARSLQRDAVFAEEGYTARKRAIRTRTHKFIKRLNHQSSCLYCGYSHGDLKELYDLREDPEENQNRYNECPELADQLEENLGSWIDTVPDPKRRSISFEENEKVMGHLEDMGYI